MTNQEITHRRLSNLLLTSKPYNRPADVVRWLGAVQAQDYLGSLWALGQRLMGVTERDIEQAIAGGQIVRTWPMRGTIHFVAPEDAHWMLKLLTPRVITRQSNSFLRRYELDDRSFARSGEAFTAALQGGKQLSRSALYSVLAEAGIPPGGGRGLQILWRLAQEGLICFAARQGKQTTFALLDEWVPQGKDFSRDEALAELALRYFRSHGPATVQDYAWWSGLTLADARQGLAMVQTQLAQADSDGRTYWFSTTSPGAEADLTAADYVHLLPAYDEFTVAYKDRRVALDPLHQDRSPFEVLGPTIAVDGRIVGNWKRQIRRDSVVVEALPFGKLSDKEVQGLVGAARQYGRFLGLPVVAD